MFDQLLDNLNAAVDDWRSKAVRDALRPLRRVAREQDVAMLAALHPNKGQKANFRDLISGTHAFNALSRSSLLLAQHPDDGARRVLVRGKGNLSAPPQSYEFTLAPRTLELNGHIFEQPVVQDPCEGELTADDLLGRRPPESPVRDQVADQLDAVGTGQPQRQADLARAVGREPDDSTVRAALREARAGRSLAPRRKAVEEGQLTPCLPPSGLLLCAYRGATTTSNPAARRRA